MTDLERAQECLKTIEVQCGFWFGKGTIAETMARQILANEFADIRQEERKRIREDNK
jgi:hypothetical protein